MRLKQLVQEGAIGTPRMLIANIGYPFVSNPAGRQFNAVLGGGSLLDLGVYPISLAFFLFGSPDKATGSATLTPAGVDDTAAIVLSFPGGRCAVLSATLDSASPNEAFVAGTTGEIRVPQPFYRPDRLEIRPAGRLDASVRGSAGLAAAVKKSSLVRSVRRRVEPVLSLLPGRGVRRLGGALRGRRLRLRGSGSHALPARGLLESPDMPLDESLRILEITDELRRQWAAGLPRRVTPVDP